VAADIRTYIDLVCDAEGCTNELSDYSGYPDVETAREMAPEYEWRRTPDGRDLCSVHSGILCTTCEGEGQVEDESACGDAEHCAPMKTCPDCAGTGSRLMAVSEEG